MKAKTDNGEEISLGVQQNGSVVPTPEMSGLGMGFDPSMAGVPNMMGMMGAGGDFTQMQMMMSMQNGMGMNGFPMGMVHQSARHRLRANSKTGMPGMSMDPMAMQQMFMNGGFGAGMGMNGMNMGMGMGGFDGGVGFNNGWNGQQ